VSAQRSSAAHDKTDQPEDPSADLCKALSIDDSLRQKRIRLRQEDGGRVRQEYGGQVRQEDGGRVRQEYGGQVRQRDGGQVRRR